MTRQDGPPGVRRWAATLGVAALVAAVCVGAGLWQWSRHVERSAAVDVVRTNYLADPLAIEDLLDVGRPLDQDHVWHPVRVRGTYADDATVLLRNRPVSGQPGFHVLTPVVVDEGALAGAVLVVDRGWVPTAADGSVPETLPSPPAGTATLVVRLRADEPASARAAPPGQVQAISTRDTRAAAGSAWPEGPVLEAYGAAALEDGQVPAGLGALPRPTTDLGSHLSYAFQWWVFALGALVGAVVLMRRESRGEDDPDDPDSPAAPPARRRRPTAEDEEDALLDAQELAESTPVQEAALRGTAVRR